MLYFRLISDLQLFLEQDGGSLQASRCWNNKKLFLKVLADNNNKNNHDDNDNDNDTDNNKDNDDDNNDEDSNRRQRQ